MRHQTCIHCHAPVRIDRFEYARDGNLRYRICPECDYTALLMIDEGDDDHDVPVVPSSKRTDEIIE